MRYEPEPQAALEPGERLIWAGRPARGLRLRRADLLALPVGLFFLAFSVVWTVLALEDSPAMALIGIPFILFGAHHAAGRPLLDAWRRARTCYAVSDRRVIIAGDRLGRVVQSVPLVELGEPRLIEEADGSGAVVFGAVPAGPPAAGPLGFGAPRRSAFDPFEAGSFQDLELPREAFEALRQARRAALASPGEAA